MPLSDFAISTLFLIFMALFVLIGTSGGLHRWLDRIFGASGTEDSEATQKEALQSEDMETQAREYEAIVFQQLAHSGIRGASASKLAAALHFDRSHVEQALSYLRSRGMVHLGGGLLGTRYRLSEKGRERAMQEGIIPRLRSGAGG